MHQRATRRIAAVAISAAAALTVGLTAPVQAALPAVNMEAVVKAAQIDPRRPGTGLTPGAKDSVLAVERALDAKNLLSPSYVDGHFGSRTVEAYAAYQRSLGYTGLGANGLPGPTSLKTLGTNRFTVTRAIAPGARITYHGKTTNSRTGAMLLEAERLPGRQVGVTQGSYNAGGVGLRHPRRRRCAGHLGVGGHDRPAHRDRQGAAPGRCRGLVPRRRATGTPHPRDRDQRHRPVFRRAVPGRRHYLGNNGLAKAGPTPVPGHEGDLGGVPALALTPFRRSPCGRSRRPTTRRRRSG